MLDKIRIKASLYNGKNKELINNILENDNCFFQMKYETSYNLLKEIGIEQNSISKVLIDLLRGNR